MPTGQSDISKPSINGDSILRCQADQDKFLYRVALVTVFCGLDLLCPSISPGAGRLKEEVVGLPAGCMLEMMVSN